MTTLVIFGASGDLTKRKLIPALFHLDHLLPPIQVIGIGRRDLTDRFNQDMKNAIEEFAHGEKCKDKIEGHTRNIVYHQMDFDDQSGYAALKELLVGDAIFYLSTAPEYFAQIAHCLADHGMNQNSKLVIEKPFGYDLDSAQKLSQQINQVFSEEQIYRIDHYLGKEAVQNIPIFRNSNTIFEPTWNSQYIDHIQVTAAETVGVEDRGPFFETTGALRDMVQNHIMEMIALTTMDLPKEGESFRDKKIKLLQSIKPISFDHAIRGQYDNYRQESRVSPNSNTETYVAIKLEIDSSRWHDVPIYLRTGKKLHRKVTEIAVVFKKGDRIIIRIQPRAGISIDFATKETGFTNDTTQDIMKQATTENNLSNGYERLLIDVIRGDQRLFVHKDSLEATWALYTPLLEHWAANTADFPNYTSGSSGPQAADKLLERDRRKWLT